nr:MAG TPA: Minor structural protein 4 [Caudoviricetes sp.]
MITIYDSRETDFSTLGLCVLQPTECTIEGEENGMMELSMTHPMDKDGRWLNLAEYNIIRAPAPVRETPLIRVLDNPGASGKTATRTICKVKTYTGKRLRLRAKPSTSAKVLGYYAPGTEVVRLSVSGDWAQVVIVKGGASGWMSNERLQVVRTETENVSGSGTENVSKCIEPRQTREQLFRICEVETDDEAGLVYVTAKHIFYDLAYNTVKGDYSPDGAAVGEVCAQLLARALDPHDFTVYCNAEGTVTGDYGRKGIASCLLESEVGVADQTGAKIVLDNYDVFILKDETRDNGVEIRHAKNMTGATLKKNVESTITRIVPVGKDKNGDPLPLPNGEYVETPRAASIPVIHSKEIEYDVSVGKNEGEYKDNAAAYAKLRELATADFADNALDAVTVGLDVDFVILENRHSESYAAYAALQTIHMGDTVRVVSSRSGIDAKLRMTGFTYDAMYPNGGRYKKVRLGQLTDLKTQVYGFDIARGTTPGNKILPNSLDGQAALKNATIGYAKIAQAAIEQLAADSIVAIRADIHEIVAGSVTTDQLYADLARLAVAQITTANIKEANIDWAQIAELTAQIANISKAQITTANINAANINWAQITSLSAAIADIATAKIGEAEIKSAQITDLEAEVARIAAAKIAVADIDWAHIKDLVAGTAIFTAGVGDKLHIARLAVTEANMVSLSVGELLVKGQDGSFYSVSVDANGNIVTEKKQVVNSDVKDLSINAGEKIIEGTVTAACLNANDIFANNATIKQLIAANIDVDTLFAREATINSINAMDIRGNKYLQLYVTDKVDGIAVGGRNLLRNTNQGTVNWDWSMQTGGKTIEEYLDGGVRAVKMTRDATPHAGWSVISYAIGKDAYALLEPDAEYIVSMDYKSTVAAPNGISVNICTGEATDHAIQTATYDQAIPADEWTHIAVPIKTKSALPAFNYQLVYLTGFSSAVNSVHIFKNLKLEKGNKATDWSPAPEDIEERMSAAELKIEPDAIVSTVTSSASYKTLSSKADDNATDITGLKTRMTTAESKIDQKADSITLSVLETKVDGISVGGRNLLRNTNQGTVNWDWSMQTGGKTIEEYLDGGVRAVKMTRDAVEQTGWSIISYAVSEDAYAHLEPNTEYTLSFDYKPSVATANGVMFSIRRDDGSNAATNEGGYWKEIPANEWTHVSGTFTTVENIPDFLLYSTEIFIVGLPATVNSVHIFKNLKLEKGNKSTDWSPAPEDPAGSLSVNSDYSKVDINTERVRIVSKRMEVAVPSEDGEDDVLRVDADGVHAEVVEADRIVSDSVVHTHGAASYTPANAGELAAILEELSGKTLTGAVVINCANVTGGTVALSGIQAAGGRLEIDNGTFGEVTITDCQASVYFYGSIVENANLCIGIYRSQYVHLDAVKISGDLGLQLGYESNSGGVLGGNVIMISCTGNCYSLARLGYCSVLRMIGSSKPSGIIQCAAGSEVYNATPDPTFTAASSPSIPTTQTVMVSLSPTSTSTSGYGSKLYQGRYSSSQSLRKGVMLFSLPSDLTSADKIDSATLTIKRIGGVGQGGGVSVHLRCYDVPGTLYASKTAYENQTVSIDVTSAVKAMKTHGYGGLMLYNPDTTTAGSKSYTASYSRFAGKGESGAPVLKISYRK